MEGYLTTSHNQKLLVSKKAITALGQISDLLFFVNETLSTPTSAEKKEGN